MTLERDSIDLGTDETVLTHRLGRTFSSSHREHLA